MGRQAIWLAWRVVTHDSGRLLTSLGGITFAAVLIIVQLGFRNGLLDSSLALLDELNADVLVIARDKLPFLQPSPLRRQRLMQAAAVDGVLAVHPLWFQNFFWRDPASGAQRPVRVVGVVPGSPVFVSPKVTEATRALARPDTALIDRRGRPALGAREVGPGQIERLGVQVVGTLEVGTDIAADGHLVVSDETFLKLAAYRRDWPEVALVQVAPTADPEVVAARLSEILPGDVVALTKAQLRARDWDYWKNGTPVSILVTIGMSMGFLIGVGICYQILYINVSDHLAEFATAKAMGYGSRYVVTVVVTQAVLLGVFGVVPALVLGAAIYKALAAITGLVVTLTFGRAAFVMVITIGMCVLASALATRRVLDADPAELF
jgi:putative ABC transport system permease protein